VKKVLILLLAVVLVLAVAGCRQEASVPEDLPNGSASVADPSEGNEELGSQAADGENGGGEADNGQPEDEGGEADEPGEPDGEPEDENGDAKPYEPEDELVFAPIEEVVGSSGTQQTVTFFPFVERTDAAGLVSFVIYFAENHEVMYWAGEEDLYRVWADPGGFIMGFGQSANTSPADIIAEWEILRPGISVREPTADFPFYVMDMGIVSGEGHEGTTYLIDNGQGGVIHFDITLSPLDIAHGHGERLEQSLRSLQLLG